MPGTQQGLRKRQLSLPSLLWRVIPVGTSPAEQGSACLAASLPYLPSPSLSLKGSPRAGWPDEVMAASPQRGAFVSGAQPILSGVRFYITCCGPLSLNEIYVIGLAHVGIFPMPLSSLDWLQVLHASSDAFL